VQRQEHRLHPFAIQLIAEGRVRVDGRRVVIANWPPPAEAALANPDPA
jgi:hypothetical protein